MKTKWVENEIVIVKENYGKQTKEWFLNEFKNKYTWMAIKEMARKLGVTKQNKKRINKENKWSKELIIKFKELWVSGNTEEIKTEFKEFSYEALTTAAKRFNVKRDDNLKFNYKLSKLLENSNFNYYWLGFIMADGCFSNGKELKISLSVKDYEHLKIFSDYFNLTINTYNGQKYGKYTSNDYCVISVMDVKTIPLIIDLFKITGQKTYSSCSLDVLDSDEKFLSFFCGFVDGDGCITQSPNGKANMLRIQCHKSWFSNLIIFGERLNKMFGVNYKCYIDKQGYVKFGIYRYKELVTIKNEINKLNVPKLERKWIKIN